MAKHLTARETEIVRLIARGYTNAEIAEQLCMTEKSITTRIHEIMRKLGLSRRVQLAIYALKTGLVHLDDIEL